jgi:hypothetical protein
MLSRQDASALLHEMIHAYMHFNYGTVEEDNPEDYGDKVYGITDEEYKHQMKYHGRKFGSFVEKVCAKTSLSFDEVFQYSVKHSSEVGPQTLEKYYGNDIIDYLDKSDKIVTKPGVKTVDGVTYMAGYYRKTFDDLKNTLIRKQNQFSKYFKEKFNIDLIFNITEDDTNLFTFDNKSQNKIEYTLKYILDSESNTQATAVLYKKIYINSLIDKYAMINSWKLTKITDKLIKEILKEIYIDTVQY